MILLQIYLVIYIQDMFIVEHTVQRKEQYRYRYMDEMSESETNTFSYTGIFPAGENKNKTFENI